MRKKKRRYFLDRDGFNKEFENVHPENDKFLHILSAALSKKNSIHSVMFPHYTEVFVGYL